MTDILRSQPYSEDAEKALLSLCLCDSASRAQCRDLVPVDAMYHPANRLLYQIMMERDATGQPVELLALSGFLLDTNQMDKIGGAHILSELYGYFMPPSSVPHFAKVILDKWRLRRIISVCTETIQFAFESHPDADVSNLTAQFLAGAMNLHASTIQGGKKGGRMLRDIGAARIGELANPKSLGLKTHFKWLDETMGGLRAGRMWVISGGTSDGKSSLALQMVLQVAEDGHPGSIYSLEMPGEELWERNASQFGSIRSSVWQLMRMNPREQDSIRVEMDRDLPVMVFDDMHEWSDIMASIRLQVAERGIKWAMIDYLQLGRGNDKQGREREIAKMSEEAKQIAMAVGIPVLLLCQLNDDGKLRESRAIGQNADHVIKITASPDDDTKRVLRVEKNRGGRRFVECLYEFQGEFFRFTEKGEITKRVEPEAAPKWQGKKKSHYRGAPNS